MEFQKLFEKFELEGHLLLPDTDVAFKEIPWSKHPTFAGVELKHILSAQQSGSDFSFHLVRIAPGCKIGGHVHKKQLETHEVLAGNGVCINNGTELKYKPGIISIFPAGVPHEVLAGPDGLYLFAKFMPALC